MFWNFNKHRSLISVTNLNDTYIRTLNDVRLALGKKAKDYFRKRVEKKIFVLDFDGDVMASQAKGLAFEVSSILFNATENDTVLVRLNSPGGAAHAYGYAASQIERLKNAGLYVVVSVDKMAASGGYMMACVADKIIAAPYAIIGSIGVVAEFPNFFNFLQNLGIDYKQYTAGRFKRTVSPMGKITEDGEQKFQEDLQVMYNLFRDHVSKHRPGLDMDVVATGEHWYALKALELGLVDAIKTSDEFLIEQVNDAEILQINYIGERKSFAEKLGVGLAHSFAAGLIKSFFDALLNMSVGHGKV